MEVTSDNLKQIDNFFNKISNSKFIKQVFKGDINFISKNKFEELAKRFIYKKDNNGLEWKYSMLTELEIHIDNENEYLFLNNKDEIKKLWVFNELTSINRSYKELNISDSLYIENFGFNFELIEESEKNDSKNFDLKYQSENGKTYIYRNIYNINNPDYNFNIRLIEEKSNITNNDFKTSGILNKVNSYKIELIFKDEVLKNNEFINYIGKFYKWLLEEFQSSSFIINLNIKNEILDSFRKLMDLKEESFKTEHYLLAEPVQILRRNFHKSDNEIYIRENYSITHLTDGKICFLYIPSNFKKSVDNNIFILQQDFSIISTGKICKDYEETLFEGYYSKNNKIFYITDILFFKGEDIRLKKFYTNTKEQSRYDYMLESYKESILKSKYIKEDLSEETIKFILAKYLHGNESKFDMNQRELLESNTNDYNINGLLYKSNNEHYPLKGGINYTIFKWTYPEFKSMEFLVKIEKEGDNITDKITPIQFKTNDKTEYSEIIYYKSLKLKVGGYRNIFDLEKKVYKKKYTVVDFVPKKMSIDDEINIANLPINNSGKLIAKNPISGKEAEIENNSIVEFVYEQIFPKNSNEFKWTPININDEKTNMYKNGDIAYGDSETYANYNWQAILNPVTENMLKENEVPEEESTAYYSVNNELRLRKYPFQDFHNRVVKDKLITSVSPAIINNMKTQEGELLDLACGQGGDMYKWKLGKLKKVIGLEISKENVETAVQLYKRTSRPKPYVQYLWSDCSKLIFPNYDAALDFNSKELMKKSFIAKYNFDVVSCQFSIHYFFENEITLRTILQNISDNLKIGGSFIGTSFDGRRVFELLKGMKKPAEGFIEDKLLWKITKKYSARTFNEDKPNLGLKIENMINTIGLSHEEYLVNYKYFVEIAKEYGLKMKKIRGFGEIFESIESDNEHYSKLQEMSAAEKQFSFLHNEFIFEKTENASDKVYGKLITLMNKADKKKEKLGKLNKNNRIKIVIKKNKKY